jgi:sugar phosphate permease
MIIEIFLFLFLTCCIFSVCWFLVALIQSIGHGPHYSDDFSEEEWEEWNNGE